MDTKKIFVLLLLGLFMISMASAFEFDNVKSYDSVEREVTIKNAYGLGDTIGKARLNTPLNVNVGVGYQKVAEFDLWAYEDYNDALKQFTFKDMKNGKVKINRDYDLKYLTYENMEVDDYKQVCNKEYYEGIQFIDKEYYCEMVKVGSHIEQKEKWNKITHADLKKNEKLTVGIFTDVQEGDYVDWIPMIYGVEIEEWASWTDIGLNMAFISYYDFEEASGSVLDSQGSYDLTNTGATPQQTGKINYDYSYDGNDYISGTNIDKDDYNTGLSYNVWVNITETSTIQGVVFVDFESGSYGGAFLMIEDDNDIHFSFGTGVFGGTHPNNDIGFTLNTWHMLTMTHNVTLDCLYMDGVQKVCFASGTMANGGTDFSVGRFNVPQGWYVTGNIDELGIWGDDLTQTQITALHNDGAGLSINETVDLVPTITLNSPTVDANYSSPQNLVINFTASDDFQLSDVKLYVNDVLNQTNASGINNSNYLFDLALGDGSFIVKGIATDNASQTTNSSSVTFVIDSTLPTLTNALGLDDITTWTLPINSSWNYTATDTHIDQCYYNTTANATQTVITCNSSIVTTWTTGGNKTVTYCANDTFGLESCQTDYVYVYYVEVAQAESEDPTVEGSTVTWNLSVDVTNIPTTTATIVINGTNYAPTTTLSDANGYLFKFIKQIPDTWGNTTGNLINWSWNYTINGVGTSQQMDQENITVYELAVDDCSTYGDVILDMSLLNEKTGAILNGSLGSNVEIDLEITNLANTSIIATYNHTWTNDTNPQVCLPYEVLNNSQFSFDFTIGFQATDRVWEFFYLDNGTLNSSKVFDAQTSSPLSLFDLLTTESTSFLFNYFDQDGLPEASAIVHVYRKYIGSGIFLEVERAKADQNGDTIVHLIEEDVIYKFVISLDGEVIYTTAEYTALCQATPCTIQIEASGTGATFGDDWDLIDGGAYTISSSATTREVTLDYSLDDAGTFNFTVYKYASDGSYSVINTSSDTGTSGSIVLDVPQSAGNVSFFASVVKDEEFVNSEWINFVGNPQDRFGIVMSLFLAFLIILSLGLMATSEGAGTLIWVMLGVFLSGALGLMTIELSTGVNVIIYLIIAGGILLSKLTGGRR